jgi:hypothetical protein
MNHSFNVFSRITIAYFIKEGPAKPMGFYTCLIEIYTCPSELMVVLLRRRVTS